MRRIDGRWPATLLGFVLALGCHTGVPGPHSPAEVAGEGGGGAAGNEPGGRGGSPMPDARAADTAPPAEDSAGTIASPDSAPAADSAPVTAADASSRPSGPFDFGGVGQELLVPLDHSFEPVPPMVAKDCPDDPTQGFTEYQDSFVVQRPYDLPAKDRFSYDKGIYTAWVLPNDKSHATWSGTKSRTETRFSDLKSGEHLYSADVMVEAGSENVCVQQFKGALGPLGTYLRVNGGTLHQLGGDTVATNIYGKWINIKVAWDIPSGTGRVWINDCLKTTVHGTTGSTWYFKFGTYTCGSAKCTAHFKNIHFYQRGSTDQYNVKSTIR